MSEGGGGVLREVLAVFGFDVETEGLKKGENALGEFGEKLKSFGEGIAAAFAVDQLFEFAEANVHAMTAIEHLGAQIGVTTEQVQAYQYAARASGFESDKFLMSMSRLQVAAANGGGELSKLGINVKDASGHAKTADVLFGDVAEAISKTEDPNKRAAIATKLFGRQGRELIPILAKGREGLSELTAKYKELGGGYTEDAMEKGKEFEEAQADLNTVWTRTKSIILSTLLPALNKISLWAVKAVKWFNDVTKNSKIFQVALAALGAAGLIFAAGMVIAFAPLILATLAIGALLLILEDLFQLFTGGKSEIGEIIDKIFGKGYTANIVHDLKDAWALVVDEVKSLVKYLDEVVSAYRELKGFSAGSLIRDTYHAVTGPSQAEADAAYSKLHPNARSTQLGSNFSSNTSSNSSGPVNITVNPAPGMNEKELGEHTAKAFDNQLKRHTRNASVGLPRSSSP